MNKSYVIALYIRLSAEDSRVGSFSIENQKRVLHQYADAMEGIPRAEVLEFVDNGYSGTNFERPAVQELLDKVREGAVNCIIVKDFTRFGRNSIEVGYFMERVFPLYGVRFISLNDNFDSDTLHGDTGGINVAFQYLISEFYSRDLSVKYKTAKYVKFRRGEYQSVICPYGYQKGADGRLEPDEETAPNVRLIFELAGRGCSSNKIIQELYAREIMTPGEYKASKGRKLHDVSRSHRIWQRTAIRNISNASLLDAKIAKHTEYSQRVESCLDQKRVLYEKVLLKEISPEEYKTQKAAVDTELERLRQVHNALAAEITQAKMDAKTKSARMELAQEITSASGLSIDMVNALIERVEVYPGNQVDIVWKMKDFCAEGM